jgi:hypothetical protein
MIKANTTTHYPTHILRGYEIIEKARGIYKMSSENWPYPTKHTIGTPKDPYYAEVWVDGMDWQHNYWIIEVDRYETPQTYPLIQFTSHDEEDKFNHYDFDELMDAILFYRRSLVWLDSKEKGMYQDSAWPYLHRISGNHHRLKFMIWCFFTHASQREVKFWINMNFIPKYKHEIKERMAICSGSIGLGMGRATTWEAP